MIATILPMLQSAISIISSFKGTAQAAKLTGYVQDAVGMVTALTPLVQQFGEGKEITEADVRTALAGKDAALATLDDLIAQKGG